MVTIALYARSDLASVTVSPAHGGCGRTHSRPAPGGKPAGLWDIEPACEPCASHLRHDPLWSPTVSKIPETHDEKAARENLQERGDRHSRDLTALMLAQMAGDRAGEVTIRQLMAARGDMESFATCRDGHPNPSSAKFCAECGAPVTPPGVSLCPDGHESPAGSRFCQECGGPMSVIPGSVIPPPGAVPAGVPPGRPLNLPPAALVPGNGDGDGRKIRLRDLRLDQLAALAREKGLDDAGRRRPWWRG